MHDMINISMFFYQFAIHQCSKIKYLLQSLTYTADLMTSEHSELND